MKRAAFLALSLLILSSANAQLLEQYLQGFQSFFTSYTNIAVAAALSIVTIAVAKKVNLFGGRYGRSDNKIPIAMGIAVFVFSMVYVPQLQLPDYVGQTTGYSPYNPFGGGTSIIPFLDQNVLPGAIAGIIFIIIVAWAIKEEKFKDHVEWLIFVLMLVSFVASFLLSSINLLMYSGMASFVGILLLLLFLFTLFKKSGMGKWDLRRGKSSDKDDASDVAEEGDKLKRILVKEAHKVIEIKKERIEKPLEELHKDGITKLNAFVQGKLETKDGVYDLKDADLKILNKLQDFIDSLIAVSQALIIRTKSSKANSITLDEFSKIQKIGVVSSWGAYDMKFILREVFQKELVLAKSLSKLSPEPRKAIADFWKKILTRNFCEIQTYYSKLIDENQKVLYHKEKNAIKISRGEIKKFIATWGHFRGIWRKTPKEDRDVTHLFPTDVTVNFYKALQIDWKEIGEKLGFNPKHKGVQYHLSRAKHKIGKLKYAPGDLKDSVRRKWEERGNVYARIVNLLEEKTEGYEKMLPYFSNLINHIVRNIKTMLDIMRHVSRVKEHMSPEQREKFNDKDIIHTIGKAVWKEANSLSIILGFVGQQVKDDRIKNFAKYEFTKIMGLENFSERLVDNPTTKGIQELQKHLEKTFGIATVKELKHVDNAMKEGFIEMGKTQLQWLSGTTAAMASGNVNEAMGMIDKIYLTVSAELNFLYALDKELENMINLLTKDDYIIKKIIPLLEKAEEDGGGKPEPSPKPPKPPEVGDTLIVELATMDKFTQSNNTFLYWVMKGGGFSSWKSNYVEKRIIKTLEKIKKYLDKIDDKDLENYIKHAYSEGFKFRYDLQGFEDKLKFESGKEYNTSAEKVYEYVKKLRDNIIPNLLKKIDSYLSRIEKLSNAVEEELEKRSKSMKDVKSAQDRDFEDIVDDLDKKFTGKELSRVTKFTQAMFKTNVSITRNMAEKTRDYKGLLQRFPK